MIRYAIDTGPIVALLNAGDEYHAWARDTLDSIDPPLRTCESVLSEACYLTRANARGREAVLSLVHSGLLAVDFHLDAEVKPVETLVKRYASVPMSLADACLVRMSELDGDLRIITLDRDFLIYRRLGRQPVPVIMPE
jgi:predicted nucleic acid-binding protein